MTTRMQNREPTPIERERAFVAVLNRRALGMWIEEKGVEYFFRNHCLHRRLVDEHPRAGKLWHAFRPTVGGMYFLEYVCPSTGKTYVSGIEPRAIYNYIKIEAAWIVKSTIPKGNLAEIAMGWKFHLTISEYRMISAEA
jgi:hypothetical protein